MNDLNRLAHRLQELLTRTADRLARQTGFVQRQRQVTGSNFAQTLIFTWMANPQASTSRMLITAAAVGLNAKRQSLEERFTLQAAEFLKQLLAAATTTAVGAAVDIPVLNRFTSVEVLDSSTVALPDDLAAVHHGGQSGTTQTAKAAVKLSVALDLKTGALRGPTLSDGRSADLAVPSAQTAPPKGGLQLADLSYFCLRKFARWGRDRSYWLSRLKLSTVVMDARGRRLNLLKTLRACGQRVLDLNVSLGVEARLPCRLIAVRVPARVARQRRNRLRAEARRRNEPVSSQALALAAWTILVTNVPRRLLSAAEALVLARMRWQIELLFKLWKSGGGIDEWVGAQSAKALCAVYGKLLAMVVQHWAIVVGCWSEVDRSPTKAAWVLSALALSLATALRDAERLVWVLGHAQQLMQQSCRMEHHKKSPTSHRRLLNIGTDP